MILRTETNNKDQIEILASSWNHFPSAEDPTSRYKYTSVVTKVDSDLKRINRQTYSILD